MPCRDYEPTPAELARYSQQQREKVDFLTSKLCAVLEMITSNNSDWDVDYMQWYVDNDADLSDWWETHKQQDARRKAAEEAAARVQAIKESALAKLTPEEKKILNIR